MNFPFLLAPKWRSMTARNWQRRFDTSLRNKCLSRSVSARALIIRLPMLGSDAHEDTRPHFMSFASFPLSPLTMTGTDCVGAMLAALSPVGRRVRPLCQT